MDSDVSVEGDGDTEQSPNRSWASNDSVGSPSSCGSPERNTDVASSSEDEEERKQSVSKTPPPPSPKIRYDSSSERESSPEGNKHSDATEENSSSDAATVRDRTNGIASGSPRTPPSAPQRQCTAESDGSATTDVNDGADDSSSGDDDEEAAKKLSSAVPRSVNSSPEDEAGAVTQPRSADSSPETKPEDDSDEDDEDASQTVASPQRRDSGDAAAAARLSAAVSPENGTWASSDSEKTAPNSPAAAPASPTLPPVANDDESTMDRIDSHDDEDVAESPHPAVKKKQKATVEREAAESNGGEIFESVNGDAFAKSPKRSASICSNRTCDESSLDSVSLTQFDPVESNKSDDEEEAGTAKTVGTDIGDEDDENKKVIIDFADDLSDVSDIESNDSFGDGEESVKENEEEVEQEEEQHEKIEKPIEEAEPEDVVPVKEFNDEKQEDAVSLHVDNEEQLDFEAEEGEISPKQEAKKAIMEEKEEVMPEKEQSDLEEGELTDDNDAKTEETERPVCRFFSRGHCTWGSNCRFIHPGVMDKGNYSMFDTVRPIVTPGGPPPPNPSGPMVYPMFLPHIGHPHLAGERGIPPPGAVIRKEDQPAESAWERGLRQAKEMIRKSSKRKETEVDFEDKKMNLTLSQDEIDKENDYYSRQSGSPVKSPDLAEKWKMEADAKSHRADPFSNDMPPPAPHGGPDVPPVGYYPPLHHGISRPDYWNPHRIGGLQYDDFSMRPPHIPYGPDFYAATAGRRYMHPNSYYPPRPGGVGGPPPSSHMPDFYDRKQKHKQYPGSGREVIVQKNDKPYKDDSPARYRNRRGEDSPLTERTRDDEWADPWMRTKSPAAGQRRRRKNTYSSGSSYSSSSESSRSSSRSSFSSRSHQSRSRSKVRSSGSPSSSPSASETIKRKKPMQFKLSPSSRPQVGPTKKNTKPISPSLLMERRAATERAMHMNPPLPSPKVKGRVHSPSNVAPTTSPPKPKNSLPERLLAPSKAAVIAAMRSNRSSSRSSKSSSGSSSSDSSSDSSDSSASSSSSSKSSRTPPIRAPKRNIPDEHISASNTVMAKAMDALKLSGQKQQIKLTLKGSGGPSKRSGGIPDILDGRKGKERQPLVGKKRVAESSDSLSDSDHASPAKKTAKINQKKGPPSRRDELLKQLKAVEDAIARKRSKNL